ncbi:MAG: hypothetical protein ACM3SQ_00290 [Betaproteobacteria bacterium]
MAEAPETLETLGAKIIALGLAIDRRFEQVDKRFEQVDRRFEQVDKRFEQVDKRFEQVDKRFEQVDRRLDEVKAHLRIEIEALGTRLTAAFDGVIAAVQYEAANRAAHAAFEKRLDDHDLRLTALERGSHPNQ